MKKQESLLKTLTESSLQNHRNFAQRHLIGLRYLNPEQLALILNQASLFKKWILNSTDPLPFLTGFMFANLFFEPSTRTRVSFERAIKYLGADTISISIENSSFKKGETLYDTAKNLEAMKLQGIIIRHSNGGSPHFISQHISIPVVNAGDGYTEHPTQGLLDILTLQENLGDLKGKHIVICGDIYHSRVARSDMWGLLKCGAKVTVCGPKTLIPIGLESLGVNVVNHIDQVIENCDAVNMLRIQYERQDIEFFPSMSEYRRQFSLTEERRKKMKEGAVVLHPGPINRGCEIDSSVADGPGNVILEQVTNGIAVRMAVLFLLSEKPNV